MMSMERLRISCATDTETRRFRENLQNALNEQFDVHFVSIDRSQKSAIRRQTPDLIFVDCDLMNDEQLGELRGFLNMTVKHFSETPVILRAPTGEPEMRTALEAICPENVLGVIGTDRAYEYIASDVRRMLELKKSS